MEAEHDDPAYISPIDELSFAVEMFAQALQLGALSVTGDLASIPFLTRMFQQKCDEIFEAAKAVLHIQDIAVDVYQVVFELREACQSLNPESWLSDPETYHICATQNADRIKMFSETLPDKLSNLKFRLQAASCVNRLKIAAVPSQQQSNGRSDFAGLKLPADVDQLVLWQALNRPRGQGVTDAEIAEQTLPTLGKNVLKSLQMARHRGKVSAWINDTTNE